MGLLKKFKNIFVEEYEDEEEEVVQMPSSFESRIPTRTEIPKKDINTESKLVMPEIPVKQENNPVAVQRPILKENPVHVEEEKIKIEPVQPKKEDKFVFPVYFDESDFGTTPKKEEKPKPKVEFPKREERVENKEVKKESSYKEAYNNKRASLTEDKKTFKPTPIISPVYGILDKNYYKEDIVVTTSVSRVYSPINPKPMTIDDVRNKAFGTLEDELADSIISDGGNPEQESNYESNNDDIFNASDFETAVEEDKKRDIAKDGLKSDIESLLNNEEFTSALNFRKTKIVEPEEDEVIPLEKEKIETSHEDEKEKTTAIENKEKKDADLSLIEDIMALAQSGKKKNNEIMNNEEEFGNDKEEILVHENNDFDFPDNINDAEIENAYDDVSDLNDSDLFNLIDSMYDKEDK